MSEQSPMMNDSTATPAPWDPFQLMDRLDEEALRRELDGVASSDLVYVVKEGGREVVGLSKTGVDECCMALVSQGQVIREEDMTYELVGEDSEREALFKVKAARFAVSPAGADIRLDQVIGVKRQALYFPARSPGAPRQLNPHWYEAGAMKAARNARFRLIPGNVRAQIIASARQAGKSRVIDALPHLAADRSSAPATATTHEVTSSTAPTEKQVAFFEKLVGSPVFTQEERRRAQDWLATRATRQTIKAQIDWLKRQVETRRPDQAGCSAA